ncbi:MAG: hypothetical protein WC437_01455 [Patescibacteria group bacterium]
MVEAKVKKRFLWAGWIILVVTLVIIAVVYGIIIKADTKSTKDKITNFETCSQKYPILQTYPEICKTPDGKSFTKQY